VRDREIVVRSSALLGAPRVRRGAP
jgi:hypothetical protein